MLYKRAGRGELKETTTRTFYKTNPAAAAADYGSSTLYAAFYALRVLSSPGDNACAYGARRRNYEWACAYIYMRVPRVWRASGRESESLSRVRRLEETGGKRGPDVTLEKIRGAFSSRLFPALWKFFGSSWAVKNWVWDAVNPFMVGVVRVWEMRIF